MEVYEAGVVMGAGCTWGGHEQDLHHLHNSSRKSSVNYPFLVCQDLNHPIPSVGRFTARFQITSNGKTLTIKHLLMEF